jgi:hypothetical protein
MEKAEVLVFAFLEKAKIRGFDKWQNESREGGTQSDCPQASHFFLPQKGVLSYDALQVTRNPLILDQKREGKHASRDWT